MGAAKAKEIRDQSLLTHTPTQSGLYPSTATYFTKPYFADLKKETAMWQVINFRGAKESTLKAIQQH